MQASGQIALEQGLTELPQFSPDVTGAGPFIGGSGEVNLDLRYLGPQRNLILLDGRRLLPSAADGTVDLNQLPQGIIGSVDIITGGASAVYGSDAVSGVVNFKTKKPFNGLDVTTSYGTTQTYGGGQFDVKGWALRDRRWQGQPDLRAGIYPARQSELGLDSLSGPIRQLPGASG